MPPPPQSFVVLVVLFVMYTVLPEGPETTPSVPPEIRMPPPSPFLPKASIYAAAGFFRIVTGDIAAGHIHLRFLKRNAAAAVLTIRIISTTVLAVVGHVAVRHADGTAFHIDTAAIAVVATIDPVARNCTAMEVQHAGIHVDTAAGAICSRLSSRLICGNYRIIGKVDGAGIHVNAAALVACAACNVAAAHVKVSAAHVDSSSVSGTIFALDQAAGHIHGAAISRIKNNCVTAVTGNDAALQIQGTACHVNDVVSSAVT